MPRGMNSTMLPMTFFRNSFEVMWYLVISLNGIIFAFPYVLHGMVSMISNMIIYAVKILFFILAGLDSL